MKKWNIALQVYTVRDAAEADFAGTMRKVKEMGYDGVELAGTYGMTVVEMKKILDEIGLELVSAHVGLDLIAQDEILADYAAAGIKFMAIPWFTGPKTAEDLESAIAQIREGAARLTASSCCITTMTLSSRRSMVSMCWTATIPAFLLTCCRPSWMCAGSMWAARSPLFMSVSIPAGLPSSI